MDVDVFDSFFVPELDAVEKVVVALVANEVGEIGTKLWPYGDVSLVSQMPFSDPAGSMTSFVQSGSKCSGPVRDICTIAQSIRLRAITS